MAIHHSEGTPVAVKSRNRFIGRIGAVVVVHTVRPHPEEKGVLPELTGFIPFVIGGIGEIASSPVHDVIAQFIIAKLEGWGAGAYGRTAPDRIALDIRPEHTFFDVRLCVACSLALAMAGRSRPARIAMIAMTTSNSIRVNAVLSADFTRTRPKGVNLCGCIRKTSLNELFLNPKAI